MEKNSKMQSFNPSAMHSWKVQVMSKLSTEIVSEYINIMVVFLEIL